MWPMDYPLITGERNGVFDKTLIGRELQVLGDNLPQCHFIYHKSQMK
jgi:hypothetical protein